MKQEQAEYYRSLLCDVYGPEPPLRCRARLEAEIMKFPKSQVDELNLTIELKKAAREQNCDIDIAGDYGASLLYFLTGCSNVNPLPPHYFCPHCKRTVFTEEAPDGWDLPERKCSCGRPMVRDGHSVPLEIMARWIGGPGSDVSYRIPRSFERTAEQVIRDFYKDQWLIVPYLTELELEGMANLENGYTMVAPPYGEDGGRHFVLIPPKDGMPELDGKGIWRISYQELFDRAYRTVRLEYSAKKEMLQKWLLKAGALPTVDDILTEPVMAEVSDMYDRAILSEERPLLQEEKLNFSSLLRKKAYWYNDRLKENPAVQEDGTRYTDILLFREDMWKILADTVGAAHAVGPILVDEIAYQTGRGGYTGGRMSRETEQMLADYGVSEYWITQMKHTWFLRPEGKLINDLLDDLFFSWYEMNSGN